MMLLKTFTVAQNADQQWGGVSWVNLICRVVVDEFINEPCFFVLIPCLHFFSMKKLEACCKAHHLQPLAHNMSDPGFNLYVPNQGSSKHPALHRCKKTFDEWQLHGIKYPLLLVSCTSQVSESDSA